MIWKSRPRHNRWTVGVLLAIGLSGQPALCWPQAGFAQLTKANGGPLSVAVPERVTLLEPNQSSKAKALEAYGKLPLRSEANGGQIDPQIKSLAPSGIYAPNDTYRVFAYSTYIGSRLGDNKSWAMVLTQVALASHRPNLVSQATPPPPGRVPPNASRVIGTVLKDSLWPPGSLENTLPPVPPDQTLYSVTLEIHASDPERSNLDSLAVPGAVIEVFSPEVLASDLVGKKLQAVVTLTGDTSGVRWWISNVRSVP